MIFRFKVLSRVRTVRPKSGVFSKVFKIKLFCCFITQLVNKLHQWSLYDVIENILPIVFNTKRPLSDIRLLSYKQNSFWCFLKKWKFWFFLKNTQNCFALISATKYRLKIVLYSKWTTGYPLSPHIKIMSVVFLQGE